MKVFISSVISGFEEFRDAAAVGIAALGHEVIRAEEFASTDAAPRVACLEGVRRSDLVVLLLGARYGERLPPHSLAPTHEEYLEARSEKPILVFVEAGAEFDESQMNFVDEVQTWDQGRFRVQFSSATDLQAKVTRAIHEHELSVASTPVNTSELISIADQMLEMPDAGYHSSRGPQLRLALVGGPIRQILRPSEIEAEALRDEVSKLCLFGPGAILDMSSGTQITNSDDSLILRQENGSLFRLNESGHIAVSTNLQTAGHGLPVIIEEYVQDKFRSIFGVVSSVLDHIDSSNRLSRLVLSTKIEGADYFFAFQSTSKVVLICFVCFTLHSGLCG